MNYIENGRLFAKDDTYSSHYSTQKAGVKVYDSKIQGAVLSIFGFAEKCTVDSKTVYVNKKSWEKFLDRNAIGHDEATETNTLVEMILRQIRTASAVSRQDPIRKESATAVLTERIATFKQRTWKTNIPIPINEDPTNQSYVAGFESTRQEHELDKGTLQKILLGHNQQFAEKAQRTSFEDAGFIERLDVKDGSELFERADLHGDLASLMAQLKLLQDQGKLDKNYRCVGNFQMVFCGDYSDRSANDVEVLSILLLLRMINPNSVHLIRGNHEDVLTQASYSKEGPWLLDNKQLFSSCYATMPLAICVGSEQRDAKGKRHFTHFSHALFSPSVDLLPLLKEASPNPHITVKKQQSFSDRVQTAPGEKQQKAYEQLSALPPQALAPEGYLWDDVSEGASKGSRRGGAGYQLSTEDIHAYAQLNEDDTVALDGFVSGHEHTQKDWTVETTRYPEGKVIVKKLPVGIGGGFYAQEERFKDQNVQGKLVTVQGKMREWPTQNVVMQRDGTNISFTLEPP